MDCDARRDRRMIPKRSGGTGSRNESVRSTIADVACLDSKKQFSAGLADVDHKVREDKAVGLPCT